MNEITELIAANGQYASRGEPIPPGPRPSRELAIVTCMDVRIEPLSVFGLGLGEAHVMRNAGGRVTEDVLRSLAVSVHALGTRTVVVMQHTKCGMTGVTDAELRELTGADFAFGVIDDHAEAIRGDIELITSAPYLEPVRAVAGLLYDVETGEARQITSWERES